MVKLLSYGVVDLECFGNIYGTECKLVQVWGLIVICVQCAGLVIRRSKVQVTCRG